MKNKILKLLAGNGRISFTQMAVMLDSTKRKIATMIKESEEEKIILKYSAVLNWEKAGSEDAVAIFNGKVSSQREVITL